MRSELAPEGGLVGSRLQATSLEIPGGLGAGQREVERGLVCLREDGCGEPRVESLQDRGRVREVDGEGGPGLRPEGDSESGLERVVVESEEAGALGPAEVFRDAARWLKGTVSAGERVSRWQKSGS